MIRDVRCLAVASLGALLALLVSSEHWLWTTGVVLLMLPWDMFGLWIAELVETWRAGKASRKEEK